MGDQPLSVVPKPFVCSICGKSSESSSGWIYRKQSQGRGKSIEIDYCPNCAAKAQQEIEKQGRDANLAGAAMFGAGAAAVGSGAWYALVVATDKKYVMVAMAVGFLVGRAVFLGSGKKRNSAIQAVSGAFALLGLAGGEYLITNHLVRKFVEGFTGWLSVRDFLTVYPKLLDGWDWIFEFGVVVFGLGIRCSAAPAPQAARPRITDRVQGPRIPPLWFAKTDSVVNNTFCRQLLLHFVLE